MTSLETARICFITTPGELTQPPSSGYSNPLDISPSLPEVAEIDVVDFTNSNAGVTELSDKAAEAVHSRLNDYDGFVVTAAKDNIQYMAPRLAFAFGPGLGKTIVVAGTAVSAESGHRSKAGVDLIRSTMVAKTPFREVVIFYEDSILRGVNSRFVKHDNYHQATYEAYEQPRGELGAVTAVGVEVNHLRDFQGSEDTYRNSFETNIAIIPGGPGIEPDFYKSDIFLRSSGIIIKAVGWAVPSREPYSLIPLIAELNRRDVPVMLTSQVSDQLVPEDGLRVDAVMEGLGGVVGRFMSPETAITKFSWVVKRVNDRISEGSLPQEDKLSKVRELIKAAYVGEYGIHKPFNRT